MGWNVESCVMWNEVECGLWEGMWNVAMWNEVECGMECGTLCDVE